MGDLLDYLHKLSQEEVSVPRSTISTPKKRPWSAMEDSASPMEYSSSGPLDHQTQHSTRQAAHNFDPPPSAQALSVDSPFSGYDNLQSIEDFEKENPWQPKAKPKLVKLDGNKTNPQQAVDFYHECDRIGRHPVFDIVEQSPYNFSGSVRVGDVVVVADESFTSKKHVKEDLCRRTLSLLTALPTVSKKRKVSGVPEAAHLTEENWIGLLHEYQQRIHLPLPRYDEARTEETPYQYTCTVWITDGLSRPFGSQTELYLSKALAKRAAAREAVIWLRSQGKISNEPLSPKTPKSMPGLANHERAADGQNHTGLTQVLHEVDVNAADGTSLPQRVSELVTSLGFMQPLWPTTPAFETNACIGGVDVKGFVNMEVRFQARDVQAEPRLAGSIGRVERVYGKKNAKNMCCVEVLRLLEDIQRSRSRV